MKRLCFLLALTLLQCSRLRSYDAPKTLEDAAADTTQRDLGVRDARAADTTQRDLGIRDARVEHSPDAAVCEPLVDKDLGSAIGQGVYLGNIKGQGDRLRGSCGGDLQPDMSFRWTAPESGNYIFDTYGSDFDVALYIRKDSSCGIELDCNLERHDLGGGVLAASLITLFLDKGAVISITTDSKEGGGNLRLNIAKDYALTVIPSNVSGAEVVSGTTGAKDLLQVCEGSGVPDTVFMWKVPEKGIYVIKGTANPTPISLSIIEGSPTGLIKDCIANAGGTNITSARVSLMKDQRVFIVAHGASGGAFGINIRRICPDVDLGGALGLNVAKGSTQGMGDDFNYVLCNGGACNGEDMSYRWVAPSDGDYTLGVGLSTGYMAYSVQKETCAGSIVLTYSCNYAGGCNRDDRVLQNVKQGDEYLVIFDIQSAFGLFYLNIAKNP